MENRSRLLKDLEKVFNTEKYSDITLSVDGKLFPAHKFLLAARCDVFAAILIDQHKEEVIEIEDVTAEIMEEILRYIYTEKVEKLDQLAKELLIAADKYGLEGLKTICGETLFKTISVSNALEMFKMACKTSSDELKRDVIGFIRENKFELMKTKAWRELQFDEQNFQMLKEIFEAFDQFGPTASNSLPGSLLTLGSSGSAIPSMAVLNQKLLFQQRLFKYKQQQLLQMQQQSLGMQNVSTPSMGSNRYSPYGLPQSQPPPS